MSCLPDFRWSLRGSVSVPCRGKRSAEQVGLNLAVIARARDNEELAELITGRMLKERHITQSETLFSFRVYSRYDLERMFSIGLE